ncbi:glycosyltransferase [Anditalea andensis]|uniref:Glycosyltransferase 2-like domain-containing protein n=1 Tax=Anditalea andensis TaxID=1048983 RepID=A0A074KSD6_9BACT|nr:glycosyltransferase [Anditalea andensis]KEO71829.1 hypothetical protein EL17_21145 [Anditalea andensis]
MAFAPVVIFSYNRLDSLNRTIESLNKCYGSNNLNVYVFSDAGKNFNDSVLVSEVREYLKSIKYFKSIKIFEASVNMGLARSIISGISKVLEYNDRVIVLEDDLILSLNFLYYMNESLDYYSNNSNVLSISGYSPKIAVPVLYSYDSFSALRSTSWGWATWKDRWQRVDWELINKNPLFNSPFEVYKFYTLGFNLLPMLLKQKNGKINSWAIRFLLHQFKNKLYSIYPVKSKVLNIGFGIDATHTKSNFYYNDELDQSENTTFKFNSVIEEDKAISTLFYKNYSFKQYIINKIKSLV